MSWVYRALLGALFSVGCWTFLVAEDEITDLEPLTDEQEQLVAEPQEQVKPEPELPAEMEPIAEPDIPAAEAEKTEEPGEAPLVSDLDLGGVPDEIVPPDLPLDENKPIQVEINLPIFGKTMVTVTKKELGGGQMTAPLPGINKPFKLGPVTLEKGLLRITEKKIAYTGDATVRLWDGQERKAKVGLRRFKFEESAIEDVTRLKAKEVVNIFKTVQEAVFGIRFIDQGGVFEVFPGHKVHIKNIDLIFTKGELPKIRFITVLFGQPLRITGILDPKNKEVSVTIDIARRPLSQIVKKLAKTPLGDFNFKGKISGSITEGFALKGELSGKEKDSAAELELLPGKKISLRTIDAKIARKSGSLEIEGVFLGQKATIKGEWDLALKDATLTCALGARPLGEFIPQLAATPLGKLSLESNLTLSRFGGLQIEGKMGAAEKDKPIMLYGLALREVSTKIDTAKGLAEVTGSFDVAGLKFQGLFLVSLKAGAKKEVRFSAKISPDMKEWRPFASIPNVPGGDRLKAIVLTKLTGGLDIQFSSIIKEGETAEESTESPASSSSTGSKGPAKVAAAKKKSTVNLGAAFYVKGEATILNVKSEAIVQVGLEKGKGPSIVIAFALPKGWKLSQSFPELFAKRSIITEAFDLLKLTKSRLILCSKDAKVEDESFEGGINLKTGVSFGAGKVSENKALKLVTDILEKVEKKGAGLTLEGHIALPDPKKSKLSAKVSTGGFELKIKPVKLGTVDLIPGMKETTFKAASLGLSLSGEPSISLEFALQMRPAPGEEWLEFMSALTASAVGVGFEAGMKGFWVAPFGYKWLTIGNLGARFEEAYENISAVATGVGAVALLIPSKFGLTGNVILGPQPDPLDVRLFLMIGEDITNLAIVGEIKNPGTLLHIVDKVMEQMGVKAQSLSVLFDKMVPVKVNSASLKFVPAGAVKIGNISEERGVGGSFEGVLFGKKLAGSMMIDTKGIAAEGSVDKFNIGPFSLTDYDGTGNPRIVLKAHLDKGFEFVINGNIQLPGVLKSKSHLELSKRMLKLDTETCLGQEGSDLCAKIHATTIDLTGLLGEGSSKEGSNEDVLLLDLFKGPGLALMDSWKLEIEFTNKLTEKLNAFINENLEKIGKALANNVTDLANQFARQAVQEDLDKSQKQKEGFCKGKPYLGQLPLDPLCAADALRHEMLRAKYDFDKTPFGKWTREQFDKMGITKLAADVTNRLGGAGVAVFEGGRFAFKELSGLVIIRRIHWEGWMKEFAQGIIPDVKADILIRGKTELKNRSLGQLDLRHPDKSVAKMFDNAAALAKEVIMELIGLTGSNPLTLPPHAGDVFKPSEKDVEQQRESLKGLIGSGTAAKETTTPIVVRKPGELPTAGPREVGPQEETGNTGFFGGGFM